MANGIHTEQTFEAAIEESLLENGGYTKGHSSDFNPELGIFPAYVIKFIQETQPRSWTKISNVHKNEVEDKVVRRLLQEIEQRGALDVIRNGFTDYGVKFKMAYFKPETSLNPETELLYNQNHLSVTRQLYYERKGSNSLDMVLALNGLPIATIELKNQFTDQSVANAKKQYAYDRNPTEPIFAFKKRALVHFALDADECFMTTKLNGESTRYLPFNLGHNNGAGNPPNPHGYRTSYLWEYIWTKDSFLDIIARFLHLSTEEYELNGRKQVKETMIFPRFHQLQVVRRLAENAKAKGAGQNYLIQHSAGSGKSNSIAWLSYRLSSLHNHNNQRVFDSVIVITDRTVLDNQLQNTIYQFEHKVGVVKKINENSQQLADALSAGSNIIITTLQKFPFTLDKISSLPDRKYAIIVDEAHSSQGGEATKKMKEVLSAKPENNPDKEELESGLEEDAEDEIRKSMEARGKQTNLSFFAFTATPKPKTIQVFGTPDKNDKPRPFHVYSMKQAIQEGFILDVLKNYTTYKTYFGLSKKIENDPQVNKKQAAKAIARFLSLHPYNLAQKTEVIIEHFRKVVANKIGGKAKAMVVSSSRLHAVRYKQEFDQYIKSKGYSDVKTLVAFSGKVVTDKFPDGVTEVQLNKNVKEKELPKKFATDEYQILLVADKYQTGFDQPLLHTMYVDKKLSGVKAVQTLSRLNRMHAGKEDTFVLDFVNETDDILESFQPYYQTTLVNEKADPNHLYNLKHEIEKAQIIWPEEIIAFGNVFFKSASTLTKADQKKLYALLAPATERFKNLPEEENATTQALKQTTQDGFKHTLKSFTKLYSFLTQIMPFSDVELEKLFVYSRYLLKVLPKKHQHERFKLGDEVSLQYYRLQKKAETNIVLEDKAEIDLKGTVEGGKRDNKEEQEALSSIINLLNDRFGTDFTEADQLFFDQVEAELIANQKLKAQAKHNSIEGFSYSFKDEFLPILIKRMEQNQDLFAKIMDDRDFGSAVEKFFLMKAYHSLRARV